MLVKTAFVLAGALGLALFAFAQNPAPTGKTAAKKKSSVKASSKAPAKTSKAAPGSKDGPSSKSATSKSAPLKKSSSKNVASSTASRRTGARKSTKATAPPARRSLQQQPTPDRYKEIQQALSDKGYFGGTADGTWGPDSVDALKRFQHDQNLTEDGKIGSLALIALGLGPRHDNDVAVPASGLDRTTP